MFVIKSLFQTMTYFCLCFVRFSAMWGFRTAIACSVQATASTQFIYHHGAIWYGENGGYCLRGSRTFKSVENPIFKCIGMWNCGSKGLPAWPVTTPYPTIIKLTSCIASPCNSHQYPKYGVITCDSHPVSETALFLRVKSWAYFFPPHIFPVLFSIHTNPHLVFFYQNLSISVFPY